MLRHVVNACRSGLRSAFFSVCTFCVLPQPETRVPTPTIKTDASLHYIDVLNASSYKLWCKYERWWSPDSHQFTRINRIRIEFIRISFFVFSNFKFIRISEFFFIFRSNDVSCDANDNEFIRIIRIRIKTHPHFFISDFLLHFSIEWRELRCEL